MSRLFHITSNQITRPANTTAYAAGDLVGNDASTAASNTPFKFDDVVRQIGYQALLRRVKLESEGGTAVTNGSFRVAFFTAEPVSAAADNAAHSFAKAYQASFIGYLDPVLALTSADGPTGWSVAAATPLLFKSSNSKSLWAFLLAQAAYTPASGEKFKLVLEVERG